MNKFFIIFFASYNPIIVYLLMAQAGLGIMTIRLGVVLLTLLLIMFFFVSMVVYNREYKIKLPKISFNFFLINICFLFFIIAIVWGVLKNQHLKFIILDTLFR